MNGKRTMCVTYAHVYSLDDYTTAYVLQSRM